jgi:transcriptional regulator with XRE-family HTH domain
MPTSINRTYLRPTRDATELLGKLIQLGRKERKMTLDDLCGRAGISRKTLQKIERGDLKCEVGLVLETAFLVGVQLFEEEGRSLNNSINRVEDKLALLPKQVRRKVKVDDEF